MLRTRLLGGIESKARRGELKTRLPTGLVYDDRDRVVFDPDRQIQQALFTFFDVFRRQGSACAVVKYFHKEGLLFPRRIRTSNARRCCRWPGTSHASGETRRSRTVSESGWSACSSKT